MEEKEPDEDINSLFSKIYNSGDENTKRAMMKSMVSERSIFIQLSTHERLKIQKLKLSFFCKQQESNGTVLSTNWDEVGKKEVEVSPPDGMEYKKWGE